MDDVNADSSIISILEIQGIKFTSRNFQIEIELKQVMLLNKDALFENCVIKKKVREDQVTNNIKEFDDVKDDVKDEVKDDVKDDAKDDAKAEQKLRALFAEIDKKNTRDTSYHKLTDAEINIQIKTVTSPWFRCFLTLNPEDYLSQVKCPLLAINGSLDLQVPPKENLQAVEKALIFGGNPRYTIEELPGLNHLFQSATTGSPSEYAKIEETISPPALAIIGNWIINNVIH